MVLNVRDVAHWFRDATSDRRLEALCRLLDCCMPPELQFLNTYLDELLRRNLVGNQQSDWNMPELHEITDSTCRRRLCLILTRLKSASVLAGCIYDILIQYNFSEFFSRVMVMEEELVDEILLLFTLAANHPAMSFSQRRNLHQRLADLRETIEKSFKCYQATDVFLQHNQEYICKPLEKSSTEELAISNEQRSLAESPKTALNMHPPANIEKYRAPACKNTSEVHIKDLRVVRVQQRQSDKKYEYIFEVTWSNGNVIRIHRAYGELFDFQCKLRRRYTKEITSKLTDRKVIIPYLPARKSIKFCKGNQILPDITQYVREFTKLPDKLLHSESVENFFSDGTEKHLEQKQQTSKTKQISTHEKKDNTNVTCKHTDASHVNVDVKSDRAAGSTKNHSPKGKCSTSFYGKKINNSLQTSGNLESKKQPALSSRNGTNDAPISLKDGSKAKTAHNQPKAILRSAHPLLTQSSAVPINKTQRPNEINKTDFSLLNGDNLCTENNEQSFCESTTTNYTTTSDDTNIQDTATNDLIPRRDLTTTQNIGSPMSTSCTAIPNVSLTRTSPLPTTASSVAVSMSPISSTALSSSSLTEVASSIPASSTMTLLTATSSDSSTPTSTLFSVMTPSVSTLPTLTSPRAMSPESSTAISESPVTILTSSASTSSIPSFLSLTSASSPPTIMTSSTVLSSSTSLVLSTISKVTSSTLSSIASSTSNMITSYTPSVITPSLSISFNAHSDMTIKSPQIPLTVAVPLLLQPCTNCPISNQSSSDGSLTSSLSWTPLSSPVNPQTPESGDMKMSFNSDTFNGAMGTCLTSAKSISSGSKLCHCEKLGNVRQDSTHEEVLLDSSCNNDNEMIKIKKSEKQTLKVALSRLRPTPVSDKNGFTRSHNNLSRHGLLIVPNGCNYLHSDDPRLNYNNYDCHIAAEQNHGDDLYEEGYASHGVKTNDKNCNYIFQNGGHNEMLDFNSNTSYEHKNTPYLKEKSNGFSKPFCYHCGEYGHLGCQCSEAEIEESIVS